MRICQRRATQGDAFRGAGTRAARERPAPAAALASEPAGAERAAKRRASDAVGEFEGRSPSSKER